MRKKKLYFAIISMVWMFMLLAVTSYSWIARTWTPAISEDTISISTTGALVISLVDQAESTKYNEINLNTLVGEEEFIENFSFKQVSTMDCTTFHAVDFTPILNDEEPVFVLTDQNVEKRYIDVTFYLTIQQSANEELRFNKYIFIHPDTEISDKNTNKGQSDAIRVAITINDGNPILLCNAPDNYNGTKNTIVAKPDAAGKTLYKVGESGVYNPDATGTVVAKGLHYYHGGRGNGAANDYNFTVDTDRMLVRLQSGGTCKINLKIWLEGGDNNCVETIAGEAIKLVLKFDCLDIVE